MASDVPRWPTLIGMGAAIAALLVVGFGLGWLIDHLLDTFPIFVMVGLGLGIAGACSYTIVQFRRYLST
jgi:hypothetical protein